MTKQRTPQNYIDILRKLKRAGIENSPPANRTPNDFDELPDLEERVEKILGIVNRPERKQGNMLFFVMYDIESDKVRYNVVKYLERQGCIRMQKSIFLADLPGETYQMIKADLAEVQALYDNHDSIIVCPVSLDLLQSMKVIGKSINIDVVVKNKNTLFF